MDASVDPSVALAMVAYSGGGTHIPPTTTNWGACWWLLFRTDELGRLVCNRYF